MRRIVLLIMLNVCALSVFARNEEVSAITYNPSRLGVYEKLVAVREATFRGGVDVNGATMNIQSAAGGTITLSDTKNEHQCKKNPDGHCILEPTWKVDRYYGLNKITTINATGDDRKTSANMSNTLQKYVSTREGQDTYFNTYEVNGASPAVGQGTAINVHGGMLRADGDSYIRSFDNTTVDKLTVTTGLLQVEGSNGFYAKDSFKLGRITVSATNAQGCTTNCKSYKWVDRVPDGASNAVKVLAVQIN